MPAMDSSMVDRDMEPFVEVDPTGRYGRYGELLGAGAVKKVYRAFDQEEGIEVAWNQVKLRNFCDDEAMINRLYSEVRLLRNLKNKNIIALYSVWRDGERNTLNFITEVCTSGNLREYRKKHKQVSLKALKKWSRQILKGLDYLHTHEPCVIHRDLNCSNVFINGNVGQFGMLEMVTLELPYSECDNVAKIYKKVTSGLRPQAMNKVKDPEVQAFIEKCLAQPRARPSAADLLKDPFFDGIHDDDDENADDYSRN
ncbi:UNVERIFIED_CONTAM: putative serine/threonine-protein kinase WNK11 [Sesamum calycinum]|uniref:non-specific serine/threonine protein kinase n=1 Tax=Sesamum calycinum TaxID=2727403 RepID=A0AAW2Q5B8_9LAMI